MLLRLILIIIAVLLSGASSSCILRTGTVRQPEISSDRQPASTSPTVTSSEKLVSPDTIRLTNGEWPPYLSEHLAHYGIASRIVSEAFALEGIEVEYGFFPWKRALELARSGEWDGSVVWLRTPDRERDFYFSDPVIRSSYVFWHRKDFQFDWERIEDLQGVRIGGTRGYFYEEMFTRLERGRKSDRRMDIG